MAFDQITLPNGLKIIGERTDYVRSVSVGLWIGTGSQFETADEAGLSHFLEHMVFKGTEHRSARQIAEEMDAVGGALNAFTARECTCFYTQVVDEHLPLAVDVIADLAVHPTFDPAEMAKEKGVVIEEINMAEDTPEDLVQDLLMKAHFGDQGVSRPILGTARSVSDCSRDALAGYWRRRYRPQNAVLALAGHYQWEEVLSLIEAHFGAWEREGFEHRTYATQPTPPTVLTREKDIEQVHIAMGYPSFRRGDPRAYALGIVDTVFGGAMSSRLFQKIREERGLAYSVYSYPTGYSDTGILSICAATNPDAAADVIALIRAEADLMAREGVSPREFTMAREQLKANLIMGQESTSARMQFLGRRLLLRGDTRTLEQALEAINATTLDAVNAIAREVLTQPHSLALVGRSAAEIVESVG